MAMLLSIAAVVPCHADLLQQFHQAMLVARLARKAIHVEPCRTRADPHRQRISIKRALHDAAKSVRSGRTEAPLRTSVNAVLAELP